MPRASISLLPFLSLRQLGLVSAFLGTCFMLGAADPKPPYQDASLPLEGRVADLLSRMTIEEKVAQVLGAWNTKPGGTPDAPEQSAFDPEKARAVFKHGIGSISRQREHKDPRDSALYANAVQTWLKQHTRLGIPALFHDEMLHGHMAQGGTHYPQPLALACTWDTELVGRIFSATALETRARGGHHVMGPNLDLGREPRWGRTEETYGEDPFLVSRMGVACIQALQGTGPGIDDAHVLATAKHFAAHGQPEGGTNIAPANFSERLLRDTFFVPFEAAVKEAHVGGVMPSYNEIDGVPSHGNRWLIDHVLRKEWGFDGLMGADYYGVTELETRHHVVASKADAAQLALETGVDMELPDPDCFKELPALLKTGRVSLATLDRAVTRVLRAKFRLGLFENALVDPDRAAQVTNAPAHRALALEAARRAIVLLKNEKGLLPLDPARLKALAVIGPNANRVHLGGYSDDPGRGVSLLEGIRARLGKRVSVTYAQGCQITREGGAWFADTSHLPSPEDDQRLIAEAVALAGRSDVVVLAIGGNEDTNKEGWAENHLGDRDSVELIGRQNDLVAALLGTGKPLVVFLINSGPLAIPFVAQEVPAILEGFYLGQEGGTAAAEVIFGDINPGGKLPISFPRSTGQLPVFYNHKPTAKRGYLFTSAEPLFPFGHGLSYTSFEYSELAVTPARIPVGGSATVTVKVTNMGARSGDEVVQFYVRDEVSSVTRPLLELKGFTRITLAPGESRLVSFPVGPQAVAFTGLQMQRVIEPGAFTLMVGSSSQRHVDTRLEVLPVAAP